VRSCWSRNSIGSVAHCTGGIHAVPEDTASEAAATGKARVRRAADGVAAVAGRDVTPGGGVAEGSGMASSPSPCARCAAEQAAPSARVLQAQRLCPRRVAVHGISGLTVRYAFGTSPHGRPGEAPARHRRLPTGRTDSGPALIVVDGAERITHARGHVDARQATCAMRRGSSGTARRTRGCRDRGMRLTLGSCRAMTITTRDDCR
jgi:hypothetical protein